MNAFCLLDKKIQKVLWEKNWGEPKQIQSDSIYHMMNTPSDMIIAAPTASGKTEAAFLPIISKVVNSAKTCVKILYISPLKALINDQFLRVEQLCKYLDFPITKWHGDAKQSGKIRLIKSPQGILLITPESIESLFITKHSEVIEIFKSIEYIVIDEVHSFIGNERGTHLRCLLNRIENITNMRPYRIALSATISNINDIKKWINHDNPDFVKLIEFDDSQNNIKKKTKGQIIVYDELTTYSEISDGHLNDIRKITRFGKSLIFANDKNTLEIACFRLKDTSKENPNQSITNYYIHHGSLSKESREICEEILKKYENIAVFCTSTLELGIDIGNIDRVLFLSVPPSVSSFTQRLGRCGRRNSIQEFHYLLKGYTGNSDQVKNLNINLIKCIAIIELKLKKFIEPLNTHILDYSTIVHQTLSYITIKGICLISDAYKYVIKMSFNKLITKEEYRVLLKGLKDKKIIYNYSDNEISLTDLGEKIINNHEFYASFATEKTILVVYEGKIIGEIPRKNLPVFKICPYFLLNGESWMVKEIKLNQNAIHVIHANIEKVIRFYGKGQNEDKEIYKKMKEIYETKFIPNYLNKNSIRILNSSYDTFDDFITPQYSSILPTFQGTKIQNTIDIILDYLKIDYKNINIGFIITNKINAINKLKSLNIDDLFLNKILESFPDCIMYDAKFDRFLPKELLIKSYISKFLDLDGTKKFINSL